jgi:hypothetical protein
LCESRGPQLERKDTTMTETALVAQDNRMLTFDEATRAAVAFAKSGFFKDASDAAQAVVKILAGQELGIGPVAAMRGISFIMGKLNIDAGLVSALIKRSGRYDYKVVENSDKAAQLDFYDRGAKVGTSRFTLDDAKAAGLLGKDLWAKYPRNMLFARALSNGAKWYAPDVFYGAVYTADELDDNATVPAIAVEVAEPTNVHKPEAADVEAPFTEEPAEQEHWIKQEKVRKYFWGKAKELGFANQRQVHAVLRIEHMEEWNGTAEEAVDALQAYLDDAKARLP